MWTLAEWPRTNDVFASEIPLIVHVPADTKNE